MASQLDMTLGVLLIAIFFNTYLFGLVTYQFVRYHIIKFNDSLWLRMFVLTMFTVDTVHSISIIYMAYWYCVTNFGNLEALGYALWPYQLTPTTCAVIALMTHIFLIRRIHSLRRNTYISAGLIVLTLASFGVGMMAAIQAWSLPILADQVVLIPQVTAWFSMSFSLDLILAGLLIWRLRSSRTGIKRTDTLLVRLMKAAVSTGLLSALFNMGALLSFRFGATTNFAAFFADPLGRVYTNTLMATLLDRADIKILMSGSVSLGPDTQQYPTIGARPNVDSRADDDVPMQTIFVKTEVFTDHGNDPGDDPALYDGKSRMDV